MGGALIASYPHVPTGYELGVGIAVQSYDGSLFFGLTADAHVVPDVARLRDYIQTCFRELCKAAGVKRRLAIQDRGRSGRRRQQRRSPWRMPCRPNGAAGEACVPTSPVESPVPLPAADAAIELKAVQAEPVLV